jgi:lipopolysaccharide/colanic/teichoic acid biosynthesis glycosyltransferase
VERAGGRHESRRDHGPNGPSSSATWSARITFYGRRHLVKPGITGWAQVSYPYGASVHDALQKLQYDLYYLKHMSVAFDLFIMLATVKTVLVANGC